MFRLRTPGWSHPTLEANLLWCDWISAVWNKEGQWCSVCLGKTVVWLKIKKELIYVINMFKSSIHGILGYRDNIHIHSCSCVFRKEWFKSKCRNKGCSIVLVLVKVLTCVWTSIFVCRWIADVSFLYYNCYCVRFICWHLKSTNQTFRFYMCSQFMATGKFALTFWTTFANSNLDLAYIERYQDWAV